MSFVVFIEKSEVVPQSSSPITTVATGNPSTELYISFRSSSLAVRQNILHLPFNVSFYGDRSRVLRMWTRSELSRNSGMKGFKNSTFCVFRDVRMAAL